LSRNDVTVRDHGFEGHTVALDASVEDRDRRLNSQPNRACQNRAVRVELLVWLKIADVSV
jgi:hypothetical protein